MTTTLLRCLLPGDQPNRDHCVTALQRHFGKRLQPDTVQIIPRGTRRWEVCADIECAPEEWPIMALLTQRLHLFDLLAAIAAEHTQAQDPPPKKARAPKA